MNTKTSVITSSLPTPQEKLFQAITKCKQHAYTPPNGDIVVKAYKEGFLNHEECLYVIAQLISE